MGQFSILGIVHKSNCVYELPQDMWTCGGFKAAALMSLLKNCTRFLGGFSLCNLSNTVNTLTLTPIL